MITGHGGASGRFCGSSGNVARYGSRNSSNEEWTRNSPLKRRAVFMAHGGSPNPQACISQLPNAYQSDALGTFRSACRSLDPECCDPAPASCHALQRQVSAVRAVCSNPARTDLCGGRGVNSRPYRDCDRERGRPLTYVDLGRAQIKVCGVRRNRIAASLNRLS